MQQPLQDSTQSAPDVNILNASGTLDETRAFTEIHLTDGRVLRLDTRALAPVKFQQFDRPDENTEAPGTIVVPLIEEQLTVGKRTVETGKVTLHKTVQEYQHVLNEPLALRTYDIERRIFNQPVDSVPLVRQEGETTIYPVVEEQLILTKQLILKEEVLVTRRDGERIDTQVVTLHREHIEIERQPVSGEALDIQTEP